MLKPQFLLTKKIPLIIYRRVQGQYIEGVWVEGGVQEIIREVNIQPLKPSEILQMPESDRTREWYKLYCAEDLRTQLEGVGGYDADEFTWQGGRYKIMRVKNYSMSILDHHTAYAARIGPTPD